MVVDYYEYLQSETWLARAEKVRERNGGMCECCNIRFITDTHHRTYERLGDEREDDLIGLCQMCHKYIHGFITFVPMFPSRLQVLEKLRLEAQQRGLRDERSR